MTFGVGNEDAVERLRSLAVRWGLFTNNGAPNVSAIVEYLLMPQLAAAEREEIDPPPARQNGPVGAKSGGGQWL